MIDADAVEALKTVFVLDLPAPFDGVVAACRLAALTGLPTFAAPGQPVPQPQLAPERHDCAQGADEAAEALVVEGPREQQCQRIGDERPPAIEGDRDGREAVQEQGYRIVQIAVQAVAQPS